MSKHTPAYQVIAANTPPKLVTHRLPILQAQDVLIKVHACGLNFADLLMCSGKYQDTPELPFTLGMEFAGEIIALGIGAPSHLEIGSRVAAYTGQGGLANVAIAPAQRCIPLPDALSYDDAAALQIAYGTSHMALTYKAHLQPGERLVVTGAAGGVGLTAVELGKQLGAEVIAVARGGAKREIARKAGADHVIDADDPDLRDKIKALGGADVVYDAVGGDLFEACFRATNPNGRILLIGFAGGNLPTIKPNHMLVKNITVIGFYWGAYFGFAPEIITTSLGQLFDWAAAGKITPHISHRLPLDRAAEGLALLKNRQAAGKVIITP
ncbi:MULTISPECIES: NADPH:quinone oxidoreductase family protein [Pacificibacter]|uniref:NADPH:quinone oxidoreductase family protein n=1 Tax=Pacificibacter TaxID=1042323 RepID=UPI001C085CF0|nr:MULTISPECIES: NADPH:quinone oxidoreductase family protein [Pacificibacter]MBU2937488.1 NADPH:quinone oxidoreductase family protein [Pacificibacter marinus]MDO6615668.1 NADPH:quinone oxidoreductase family protein [Pacificibacter sp. 1_MG-2023]